MSDDVSNVTDLETARKSKEQSSPPAKDNKPENKEQNKSSSGSSKIPFAFIETALSRWIDGLAIEGLVKFPDRFTTVRGDEKDAAIVLQLAVNSAGKPIARIVNLDFLARRLKAILQHANYEQRRFNLDLRKCMLVAECWVALHKGIKTMPRSVGWLSQPNELCMFRHDFDPIPMTTALLNEHAPKFAESLVRFETNRFPWIKRIGSIFDPQASRKQMVLLYGPADGGKSYLVDILNALVSDDFFSSIDVSEIRKPDAIADLLGMRVAVVNEHAVKFIKSEAFKTWLGGEKLRARHLYQKSFQFRPDAIFFATMNPDDETGGTLDEIPTDSATLRRIIPCSVRSIPKEEQLDENIMREHLKKELPYIASYCYQAWLTQGRKAYIENDQGELMKTKVRKEAPVDDFLAWYVEKGDVANDKHYIVRSKLRQLMEEDGIKCTKMQGKIKSLLLSEVYGAVETRLPPSMDSTRPHIYAGVILKVIHRREYRGKVLDPTVIPLAPATWPSDFSA